MKNAAHTADIADLHNALRSVAVTLVALAKAAAATSERESFSIKEFCARHRLSESQFHKLRRESRGPRLMKTGSVGVRISRQAELDWIAARESEADAAKETAPTQNDTGAPSKERPFDSDYSPFAAGRDVQSTCPITRMAR